MKTIRNKKIYYNLTGFIPLEKFPTGSIPYAANAKTEILAGVAPPDQS